MALSQLTKKTLDVSRGFTYTYYTHPAKDTKPTLALFHGWPDTALLWTGFINDYLIPNGYGVVALDSLGYGGTSKPTDPDLYAWHHLAADVMEILDVEKLDMVVSMGHDWGSGLCQRVYNFYPSRVSAVIMVNISYTPPSGQPFDLNLVNSTTKAAFGAGLFEYWHFFAADDGAAIMNKNLDSVYSAAFGEPSTWIDIWCTPDGMRTFVTEGRTHPTLPFATSEHKKDFIDRLSKDGGFAAPSCWYKAMVSGTQSEANKLMDEEAKVIKVPALFWGGEQDYVCRAAMMQNAIDAGLLPDVKVVTREGGHWALLEKPAEFGEDVLGWLEETFH